MKYMYIKDGDRVIVGGKTERGKERKTRCVCVCVCVPI